MTHFQGFIKTIGACPFSSLNPFSSPAFVLAMSGIVALAWAFQQQGWSSCVPCVVFAVRKIASVRWTNVNALARHARAFVS